MGNSENAGPVMRATVDDVAKELERQLELLTGPGRSQRPDRPRRRRCCDSR